MDSEAHTRVSGHLRAAIVFASTFVDIIINYPLWIYAKRACAGLSPPRARELYKGGGSLLCSNGPMVVAQDATTGAILRVAEGGGAAAHAAAACASGAVGGLLVGAQVEALITRAHASGASVWRTARAVQRLTGSSAPTSVLSSVVVMQTSRVSPTRSLWRRP